jgi:hypothetical protein
MNDDPKAARAAVEADICGMAREFRKFQEQTGVDITPMSFENSDRSKWPEGPGEGIMIPIAIGMRGKLDKADAADCAAMWREVTARYSKAYFVLQFLGYDQDPRELWEFPDVRRYVRIWARLTGLNDLETANKWIGTGEGRLTEPLAPDCEPVVLGVSFLAACGVFGEALRQEVLLQHKATVAN